MKLFCYFSDILSELCKSQKKFGCYVGNVVVDFSDRTNYRAGVRSLKKAALWFDKLSEDEQFELLAAQSGYFLFDSKKEMNRFYLQTVGDDGPTELNRYRGKKKVYCVTCDNRGNLLAENT